MMLQKLFDWFDDAANRVLRIAYLIPFVIATAVYFGGKLPGFVGDFVTGALPWVLAFAVETQDYTSVRKLATIWHALKAPALEDYQRRSLRIEALVQVCIVIALSAFSVWNQASYLSETWTPTTSAFGAPRGLDIAIRSVGPALFFFLTAFGAAMAKTIGEKLAEDAHRTLDAFRNLVTKQRKQAITKIEGQTVDMTDAILTVATAAREQKSGAVLASVQGAITRLANGETAPIVLPPPDRHRSGSRKRGEAKAESRRVWRQGMTPATLASKTGITERTARRHIAEFKHEPFALTRIEEGA